MIQESDCLASYDLGVFSAGWKRTMPVFLDPTNPARHSQVSHCNGRSCGNQRLCAVITSLIWTVAAWVIPPLQCQEDAVPQESWRSQAKSKWWTQGRYSTCKSQLHIQNPDSLHLWGSGQPDLEGFVAEDNCHCIHSYLILLLTLFLAQDTLIRSAEEILHYNTQNSCHLQPLGPWQNWVKTETTMELAWNTNRTNMV